jgi:hypothetical protein
MRKSLLVEPAGTATAMKGPRSRRKFAIRDYDAARAASTGPPAAY